MKFKRIIDRIDCLLVYHYGFIREELDFINSCDIKHRMGKKLDKGREWNDSFLAWQ